VTSPPVPASTHDADVVQQADARLVALWPHGRPASTRRADERDAGRFPARVRTPPPPVALGDLRGHADSLEGIADATEGRYPSAVKSPLGFGQRLGYPAVDAGAMVERPTATNRLAERIPPEADVHRLIALEPDTRNRATVRLLDAGGLRRSAWSCSYPPPSPLRTRWPGPDRPGAPRGAELA
jgi:hypothetical protein